uniref:hypothetical protein n=1 Tax=Nitrospira cf. moscoviensis SBR1015 TaxID=96242 RepID=UPI0011809FB1|nr:hypothetical protein [Nitrospira cf. moscoviensis SBR1015]
MPPALLSFYECGQERGLRGKLQPRLLPQAWVPVLKPTAQFLIKDLGTDLSQQMRAALAPVHLLLIDHSFAHQLIHR